MKINGALNIPEAAIVAESLSMDNGSSVDLRSPTHLLSPTESEDSGFASRPTTSVSAATPGPLERHRLCSPGPLPLWLPYKHLLYGAPGFSIAVFDSADGSVDHIPVPLPSLNGISDINFPQSQILCMSIIGDSQVWTATDSGSLHIFNITPELRFSNHTYANLDDSVLCIATRQQNERTYIEEASLGRQDSRTEVLLGSSTGNLTIISGERDERGGLKNPLFKCPRKVIQLGNFTEQFGINCMAHVNCAGTETYWCGYGSEIVVLRRSDWRELARRDSRTGRSSTLPASSEPLQITQLLSTECGVWSCISSTITLWADDARKLAPKLHITCW